MNGTYNINITHIIQLTYNTDAPNKSLGTKSGVQKSKNSDILQRQMLVQPFSLSLLNVKIIVSNEIVWGKNSKRTFYHVGLCPSLTLIVIFKLH